MPSMANMVWPGWTHKSTKDYNILPQMPSKFGERAFLVGGFVGSKSQAGCSPSCRAQILLNDVIFEQLVQLGLNLCTDIIRANCDNTNKMVSEKIPLKQYNNWRSNMNSVKSSSNYFGQLPLKRGCPQLNTNTSKETPRTKHSQEELVYEDKDEGGNSIYVYQEVQKSTCEVTKTSMFHVRSRTISDCSIESDDSFIIFESSESDVDVDCDYIEEDDEEDEDEEEEIDVFKYSENDYCFSDESNECDEVDYLANLQVCHSPADTPRIQEANNKWNCFYDGITSPKSPKKVSFANGNDLAQFRTMRTWAFAHRAARKGPWEMLALDTSRFKDKIQQLSNVINPILEYSHRKKIYQQRFQTITPLQLTVS